MKKKLEKNNNSELAEKGFVTVLKREFGRIGSRPLYGMLMIVLPVFIFILLWLIFQQGVPRDLPVAVLDNDNSATSRKLIRLLDATPSVSVTDKINDMSLGKDLILSGSCYSLVVFPRDMEKDLLRGRSPAVINYYNNEFLLAGSLIYRDISTVLKTVSAGLSIQTLQKKGLPYKTALARAQAVGVTTEMLFNPYINYIYFMVATLLPAILQIFILLCTVYSLGIELKNGTAGELMSNAGGSYRNAVIGKLLPYTVNFIILALLMNIIIIRSGSPMRGNFLYIIISSVVFVLAYQSIGILIIAFLSNMRLAISAVAFYSSTAFAFVGVTFPQIGMSLPAKIWAGILPLNYYTKIYVDQAMRGAPVSVSFYAFIALLLFTFIPSIFSFPRTGKVLTDEKYWGRV